MKKEILFSAQIKEEEILLCLNKTYVTTYTDFYEFQRLWFHRSYIAFKDFDKYLILVYFWSKDYVKTPGKLSALFLIESD